VGSVRVTTSNLDEEVSMSGTSRVFVGLPRSAQARRPYTATARWWGTSTVPGTGGWQTWTTVSCSVNRPTGTHDLYLRFAGGTGFLLNVNWWQFNP
jgi:arabinoxylan arabinofuranohydrolase